MRSRPSPWILAFGFSIAYWPAAPKRLRRSAPSSARSAAVTRSLRTVAVTGWALHEDGIATVDILVDGLVSGRAVYGIAKPQVSRAIRDFPTAGRRDSASCSTPPVNQRQARGLGRSRTSTGGETRVLPGKQFTSTTRPASLLPFGRTEFPNAHAELVGDCSLTNTSRRYSVVQGYALDVGVQPRDTGVGFVELLIDRSLFANTKMNCTDIPARGRLVQLLRPASHRHRGRLSDLKDSSHSGFRFILDVGALLASGTASTSRAPHA